MTETNTIQHITRAVEDAGHTITGFGPFVLTVLAVILIGYVVKFMPIINNKWIPLISFLTGPLVFVFLSDPSDAPFTMRNPIVRHVIIGLSASAIAWIIHVKFLREMIDDRYFVTDREGDTKFLRRTKTEIEKPKE